MAARDYDYLFKILFLGDAAVGKTSMLNRIQHGTFRENYLSNIGVDFFAKRVELEGKQVKLQCWDTAGQERFRTITRAYYRGCHGVILMYDVTNRHSFESLTQWLQQVDQSANPDCQKIIIGNKTDLVVDEGRREVTEEEAREYVEGLPLEIPFFEISVKDNTGVDEAFNTLILSVKHAFEKNELENPNNIAQQRPIISQEQEEYGGGCC